MKIDVGLEVNGQWIKSTVQAIVSNSINIYTINFKFTPEWEGYQKTAVFMTNNGVNIEQPIFDDACEIPWEALRDSGNMKIGVFGIASSGGSIMRYPTVWTKNISVLEGVAHTNPTAPSLSEYEQFLIRIADDAKSAEESAQQATAAVAEIREIVDSIDTLTKEEVQEVWDSIPEKEPEPEPENPYEQAFARFRPFMEMATRETLLEDATDTATCEVTVLPADEPVVEVTSISLDQTEAEIEIGKRINLIATVEPENATNKEVTWKSEDRGIAIVNKGAVVGVSVGATTITATAGNFSATCAVSVKEPEPVFVPVKKVELNKTKATIKVGESTKISAIVFPVNATNNVVEWSTSDEEVATVTLGIVVGASVGKATIVAEVDGKQAECEITVVENEEPIIPVESIELDQTELTISVDEDVYLTATVLPENATDKTVYWMVDNNNLSIVNGVITGIKAGQTTVTARAGGKTATCLVTINPVPVESIDIIPSGITIQTGSTAVLKAVVTPSNATLQEITWSSSNDSICSVSDGILTAHSTEGEATVSASIGDVVGTCLVVVKEIVPRKYLDKEGLITLVENIKSEKEIDKQDIDMLKTDVESLKENKQNKIEGKEGQFVGFDESGNPIAVDVEPGPEGPVGPEGPEGKEGPAGKDGENATINGKTAVNIKAGANVDVKTVGNNLVISAHESAFPIGAIIVYRGDYHNPPDGWVACDGANDTPDLRDKFQIVGKYTICYIMKVGD